MSFSATTVERGKQTVRRSCSGDSNLNGGEQQPAKVAAGSAALPTDVRFEELWAHMSFGQTNGWRVVVVGEENGDLGGSRAR